MDGIPWLLVRIASIQVGGTGPEVPYFFLILQYFISNLYAGGRDSGREGRDPDGRRRQEPSDAR